MSCVGVFLAVFFPIVLFAIEGRAADTSNLPDTGMSFYRAQWTTTSAFADDAHTNYFQLAEVIFPLTGWTAATYETRDEGAEWGDSGDTNELELQFTRSGASAVFCKISFALSFTVNGASQSGDIRMRKHTTSAIESGTEIAHRVWQSTATPNVSRLHITAYTTLDEGDHIGITHERISGSNLNVTMYQATVQATCDR